jgi:hypothetical protein
LAVNKPQFPENIWDGLSDNPYRSSRNVNIDPTSDDYDRIAAELIATQEKVRELESLMGATLALVNSTGDFLYFGTPVALHNGLLADADARDGQPNVVLGLVTDHQVSPGAAANVRRSGDLTGTSQQWSRVTMSGGALNPGASYYLSESPGKIAEEPPETSGSRIVLLGTAVSETEMSMLIQDLGEVA